MAFIHLEKINKLDLFCYKRALMYFSLSAN